jgi:RNA recognition motif-containing protein
MVYDKHYMLQFSKLFIGNLPQGTEPQDVVALLERYAKVVDVRILESSSTIFAFATIQGDSVKLMKALNCTMYRGKQIAVRRAKPKKAGVN